MGGEVRKEIVCFVICIAALLTASAQEKTEPGDSLVRLMKGKSLELLELDGQSYRKAVESTFLHNGTYLISDTALWNVDTKIINAWGHVQVIQDETVLTSERLDYYVDDNLASFRGTLVQLENKRQNVLRTRNLDYNTKDSVATFFYGAAMRDKDGQVIESDNGTYDSKKEEFAFEKNVNMFTDSVFVRTEALRYESANNKAYFTRPIDFWKGGYMLSAKDGWYDRGAEMFFFQNDVHSMSENQEAWSDTLIFKRNVNDVLMLGAAQVRDTTRNVYAMAQTIHYLDSISKLMLQRDAAVALRTEAENGKVDTLYCGADTLVYQTFPKCDIPEHVFKEVETRLADMFVDPVAEYRHKAAEAAAEAAKKARDEAMEGLAKPAQKGDAGPGPDASGPPEGPDGDSRGLSGRNSKGRPGRPPLEEAPENTSGDTPADAETDTAVDTGIDSLTAPSDSLAASADSLAAPSDSLLTHSDSLAATLDSRLAPSDSLVAPSDSTLALSDSLLAPVDSLSALSDSLAVNEPKDSTKIGFAWGVGNVRIFRQDMQVRCDSLVFCELDSLARFYKEPVVWNDGNRQYTSDSLFVLVKDSRMDRASLMSNAFIITQEDSLCFDQIKGAEVMAYFDTTSALRRFDALGGANALFYLREKDALATVNKVECKMMSATLKNGEVERVYYFEQPHNDAYPVVQMAESDKVMKGFDWKPQRRPSCPEDITPLKIRPSERKSYLRHPKAVFRYTDQYFPGYMKRIYREIEVRDSLARIPKPAVMPMDSLALADSLGLADSLMRRDTLFRADTLAQLPDSLCVSAVGSVADSISVADSTTVADTLAKAAPVPDAAQLREQKRAERQAAREARWAELDARDAAKAEAKKQKALEKKRARTRRALELQRRQEAKDEAKLQRYIEYYSKQKAREDARKQESESARERTSGVETGGEIPPPDGSGTEASGGDSLLGGDGPADDRPVLGGGGLPWLEGRSGL